MNNTGKAVLHAGESLCLDSLVCPSGAYTLEHRSDGTLVLRDNRAARDVWQLGIPVPTPGRLILLREGFLVLEDADRRPVWTSGGVDRRAVSAVVNDDGRLVLLDPDGYARWSRDPLSAEDLAALRPASGDRLRRGEILVDPIVSPDGRYRLTHSAACEAVLQAITPRGGSRPVWERKVGQPGAAMSLGPDGVLRAGTDSTVLQRWTGRYRLDPASFTISAVVVRDEGDIVLLGEDGVAIESSGTAAEEARLANLEREYADQEARRTRRADNRIAGDWQRSIPKHASVLIRTDFSDDDAWEALQTVVLAPNTRGLEAEFGVVDDRRLEGVAAEALLALIDREYLFIVDTRAIVDPEHPILVVHNDEPLSDDSERDPVLRVVPSHIADLEVNLSIANMDFLDFANGADGDGVFRGFL